MYLSTCSANEELFWGGGPANELNLHSILFSPFSISLNASDDDVSILICDAYLGSIWTPLHIFDNWSFSIIYHLFNPLSIMFHKYNDCSRGITCCQFTIFIVPHNKANISRVVWQICAFIALWIVTLHFEVIQFDQFKKTFTCANGQPPLVKIPCTGWSHWLSWYCYFFLEESKHSKVWIHLNFKTISN